MRLRPDLRLCKRKNPGYFAHLEMTPPSAPAAAGYSTPGGARGSIPRADTGTGAARAVSQRLPTLPMFLAFPALLPRFGFWPTLLACVIVTVVRFGLFALAVRRFGIELL